MRSSSFHKSNWDAEKSFWLLGCIILVSIFSALATELYFLAALPIFIIGAWLTILDFKKVFFLLFVSIPLSTDIHLPGGLGLNVFSEPLLIVLSGVTILFGLKNLKRISAHYILHPISATLLLHFVWMVVCVLFSGNPIISIKFVLAKTWFILPAYFLAIKLIDSVEDIKTIIWCVLLPLLFSISVILIRHAAVGFSFDGVNHILGPFYSNHVIYASMIAVCFPFVWYMRSWYPKYSFKWIFLLFAFCLMIIAIYLSYTRATMASVFIVFAAYYVIKWRMVKAAFITSILFLVLSFSWLGHKNTFLDYTPEFEKTVTHKKFDNLLEATLKGQDISIAERFYRWIAGFYMVKEKPIFGYGPGNFYEFYKGFTLNSFRTYVSDNEERSGIHNYFLMTLVEQGIPGLLLFLLFSFVLFTKGEEIYHKQKTKVTKSIAMSALLSFAIIYSLLVINDLIELDKIGIMYFLFAAILVKLDTKELA